MFVDINFIFSEHITGTEAKSFFETNYSNIYHIFYDNFIIAEANLKQKGERRLSYYWWSWDEQKFWR